MSQSVKQPENATMARNEAITYLRELLSKLTNDETSICQAAAQRGIFCNGFKRYDDGELRRCYSWLDQKRPGMTRAELEDLANRWQLARQEVSQLPIACDVQQKEHDSCRGWDDFSNEELSHFCLELSGRTLAVV